ncbi:MAG: hypothetical protein BMS9Abin11_1614 [Gammaproteobacteria bacterium]|nr:MAG: hypothetical protein BMS9Abin11_1614 [Gammaproteobacteria bacterium]
MDGHIININRGHRQVATLHGKQYPPAKPVSSVPRSKTSLALRPWLLSCSVVAAQEHKTVLTHIELWLKVRKPLHHETRLQAGFSP